MNVHAIRIRARARLNLPPESTPDPDAEDRERWTLALERILMTSVIWPQELADKLYALLNDMKGRPTP